jgi:hypothetical protein
MILDSLVTQQFALFVLAGFVAQLIDGALGMAYGITASSLLMAFGVSPAVSSATVHASECFTTGASAISHHAFGNIDRYLFRKLLIPGVCGAMIGAYVLTNISGETIRPFISIYLIVMGVVIMTKAFREFPPREVTSHLAPLGFFGAFVDAVGGGGWGPIVATAQIVRGHDVRKTIGSVNAVEFFVTFASTFTFLLVIGLSHWVMILGLALGGMLAAPFGAWFSKHLPIQPLMIFVGVLVILISVRTLLIYFRVM